MKYVTTWEKRSFQSERHMETSDVLTAVPDAETRWDMLLKDSQISPRTLHKNEQMKAIKLENNRITRIGAYRSSQSTQNIGYMIEVAAVEHKQEKILSIQNYNSEALNKKLIIQIIQGLTNTPENR